MKTSQLILLLLSIKIACYAQSDFIELDTASYFGVKMLDQGEKQNALSAIWQKTQFDNVELTPFEVVGYSVNNVAYIAKDINFEGKTERFFLEQVSKGTLSLYYLNRNGKYYFLEKDGELQRLLKNKKEYKKTLNNLTSDCDKDDKFLKHIKFNKFYLGRFIDGYNHCQDVYLPVRFGVSIGADYNNYFLLHDKWLVSNSVEKVNLTYTGFIDIPLFQRNLSLHTELKYTKQSLYLLEDKPLRIREYTANIELMQIPVTFRYTWWDTKWSPYIGLGGAYLHFIRFESSLVSSASVEDKEFNLSPTKGSVCLDLGCWYHISKRNAIFLGIQSSMNNDGLNTGVFVGINI